MGPSAMQVMVRGSPGCNSWDWGWVIILRLLPVDPEIQPKERYMLDMCVRDQGTYICMCVCVCVCVCA